MLKFVLNLPSEIYSMTMIAQKVPESNQLSNGLRTFYLIKRLDLLKKSKILLNEILLNFTYVRN